MAATVTGARAEISDGVVKIAVLNDQSSLYADAAGPGSVLAAQMAIEDFRTVDPTLKVELLSADHQNKPDVASAIARRWIEVEHVDAIVDVPNSAVALAINEIVRKSRTAFLASSTASSDITGKFCSQNTVQWTFDTWSLANATGKAIVAQGGTSWYFITADYALGQTLERDTTAAITLSGARVVGSSRHPIAASDFGSFLLQAQASKAKVVGLATAGGDMITAIKQAHEFGLPQNQSLAAMMIFITDVHSLGLETAQGLLFTDAFYWDRDDATRAWSKRFAARNGGKMPTMNHAGVYSETLAYLRAAAALQSDDAPDVVRAMRKTPIDDPLFGMVTIRADGRAIHDMWVYTVKRPSESTGPWDYFKPVRTVPAAEAFRPLDQGGCPLIAKD